MVSRWTWILLQFARKLWVRAAIFALLGVASTLVALVAPPLVPDGVLRSIGADSVSNILEILASSMLVVATFSLSTMVSAYATASQTSTPRVERLLMADQTSQNAVGTFIGVFLFSLVGIIVLSTDLYNEDARFVLFLVTVLVVGLIVVTFVGWVDHVSRLGRVSDAIDRSVAAATEAMRARQHSPHLGARAPEAEPADAETVMAPSLGYLEHLDLGRLNELAQECDGRIHVAVLPGDLLHPRRPIARTTFPLNDERRERIQNAFTIAERRSFDEDPRFGLIVLSEIATRALSPGVNDPGTAIETLAALAQVLAIRTEEVETPELHYPHVHIPSFSDQDFFEDAFAMISESGAGSLAVAQRLQKTLRMLQELDPKLFDAPARHQSRMALLRSRKALTIPEDIAIVEALAAEVQKADPSLG